MPIYIVARHARLLDNLFAPTILYTGLNLRNALWMLRSFFFEIPREVMEAAKVDGARLHRERGRVEFCFAVDHTADRAGSVPVCLTGLITSEGLFWARLSAASTLAALPALLAGWIAQKHLVRGLWPGAIR